MSSGIGTFLPVHGYWSLRSKASAGSADVGAFNFGATVPVVGDWNGDGRDDIGTFNPYTAAWSLRYGTSAGAPNAGVFVFGKKGNVPVVGDWNGDGRDDIGVYNPSNGEWSLRFGASAGSANAGVFKFGAKYAIPVTGDWNGDGKDGIGTFEPGSAKWTLRQTPNAGSANAGAFNFGNKNTLPVTGDWNGDKKDGIGTFTPSTTTWTLRQTANAGSANAGTFKFGSKNSIPVTGDFKAPAPTSNSNVLTTITLKPLDLNLLGLEVQTSPITVTISAKTGDGKLFGNLLNSGSSLVSANQAAAAMNNVLSKAVDLANSAPLTVGGIGSGTFDNAATANTQVLELFVASTHLETMGASVDMSPVRLSISAHAGSGLVLGNAMTTLSNLFNPPLPSTFDIDLVNQKLSDVLGNLNAQLGSIAPASVPTIQPNAGDVLAFAVPQIDMNLLGLELKTDAVTVDASAQDGNGQLLGNVWTTALNALNATPDKIAQMDNTVSGVLSRVFGALNASSLTLSPGVIGSLTPAQTALLSPTLIGPAGSSVQILDLISSTTPPATVDLLGLSVASNNLNAEMRATTGDGQILGNLLYNAANLTNPGASSALISLMQMLASNSTANVSVPAGTLSAVPTTAKQLFTVTLPALDLNLLGFEIQTADPITVQVTAESGDGDLLGNVLRGYTSLLNLSGVSGAVNNVLSTVANLTNSVDLSVSGIGSGAFDTASASTTPLLDATIAPIRLNLAGLQVDTSLIHLKMIAHSGPSLVLGNALSAMANVFNPPLPSTLDVATINTQLQQIISDLNAQIPGIVPATLPANSSNVLALTVPGINLDLLGMGLKTDPIVAGVNAQSGNGDLLGNLYTTAFNTMSPMVADLSSISGNVNALLAKVIGVFNASSMNLPAGAIASLPSVYQSLALPTLINPTKGASTSIFDFGLASASGANPPTSAGVLGASATTSNLHLSMTARTGDGLILGNMLFNVANTLNGGSSSSFLYLLDLL